MKLFYAKGTGFGRFNFGDELNLYLWDQLLPSGFFDDDPSTLFVGIGTLLNRNWLPSAEKTLIVGSGAGIGVAPEPDQSWSVLAVRGPLTAKAIGVDEKRAITDPAILCSHIWPNGLEVDENNAALLADGRPRRVLPRKEPLGKKYTVAYIPHFAEACLNGEVWREICERLDVHYIDPTRTVPEVLNDILSSEHLLAEAMHGAIIADTYRIPWTAVRTHTDITALKWQDWAMSLNLDYKPLRLHRPMYIVNRDNLTRRLGLAATYAQFRIAVRRAKPVLSKPAILNERSKKLLEIIERFARDR